MHVVHGPAETMLACHKELFQLKRQLKFVATQYLHVASSSSVITLHPLTGAKLTGSMYLLNVLVNIMLWLIYEYNMHIYIYVDQFTVTVTLLHL